MDAKKRYVIKLSEQLYLKYLIAPCDFPYFILKGNCNLYFHFTCEMMMCGLQLCALAENRNFMSRLLKKNSVVTFQKLLNEHPSYIDLRCSEYDQVSFRWTLLLMFISCETNCLGILSKLQRWLDNGVTLLHLAAELSFIEHIEVLLAFGVDVNRRSEVSVLIFMLSSVVYFISISSNFEIRISIKPHFIMHVERVWLKLWNIWWNMEHKLIYKTK